MNTVELLCKLECALLKACEAHFPKMHSDHSDQKILAYTLYCSAGCRSFGVAIATDRDALSSDENILFKSAEWKYVNKHFSEFSEVDSLVDELYEVFYEEELDDIDLDEMDDAQLWSFISSFFVKCVSNVLREMKDKGMFNTDNFSEELLLGLQFGDPDIYAVEMMEQVFSQLNSDAWNTKLKAYIDVIRDA